MSRPPLAPDVVRKTVALPAPLWEAVSDFRFGQRIGTEAEAVRQLIELGLAAAAKPPARKTKRREGAP